MLFFNFLCLFYLMVLINSHTISKSITKHDEIINVIDSLEESENDRDHDVKQKRFHIRNACPEDSTTYHKEWTPSNDSKFDTTTFSNDNINVTMDVSDKSNEFLVSKGRRKGFLRRLLDKMKKKKKKQYVSEMMGQVRTTALVGRTEQKHHRNNGTVRKMVDNNFSHLKQHSRKVRRLPKRQDNINKLRTITYAESSIKPSYWLPETFTWRAGYPFSAIRAYQPVIPKNRELSLTEMTTKIDYLKHLYGMTPHGFAKFMSIMTNPIVNYNSYHHKNHEETTTVLQNEDIDKDSLETSHIEELLNKMKMKAVHTVTESSEPTFEKFTLSYGIARNVRQILKDNNKRELIASNSDNSKLNYSSVGDLKKVYAKVKNQLSKEIKMSENVIKNETQYWANKLKGTTTSRTKQTTRKVKTMLRDVTKNSQIRQKKSSFLKIGKNEYTTYSTTPQSLTDDDYTLISKCELLLENVYEANAMPTLTTESISDNFSGYIMRPVRNSNYNAFVAPNIYEDFENRSSEKPILKPESSTQNNPAMTTSFKELADKLYYNDYVNGYKHYLKFQKEQGVQNYSNLVRYQAHRHHSVDDIGKFILNKLPRVPERRSRAFYDESETTEDQDVSSKSEESWFKKHFYLFIDSGQPKKYHSYQTVSLRPSITKTDRLKTLQSDILKEKTNPSNIGKHSGDNELDNLANILEMYKSRLISPSKNPTRHGYNGKNEKNYNVEDDGANASTEIDINLLLQNVHDRLKRDSYNHISDNEYQLYRSYLPKTGLTSKQWPQDDSSTTYPDVDVITKPTAVINLRKHDVHAKHHDSVLKNFFNHFRIHFQKNDKSVTKTKTQKNLQRKLRSLNPLKKLKKMFNVRIDGKPDFVGSKIFDYDIVGTHMNPYKHMKYYKPSPNLEEMEVEIPTVIPDLTKLKNLSKDSLHNTSVPQNSLLAKKYYQNSLGNPTKTSDNGAESGAQMIDTKNYQPATSTVHKTKNKAEYGDSDLINIKVTTVKNFNENNYAAHASPVIAVTSDTDEIKPTRKEPSSNNIFKQKLQNIHLKMLKGFMDTEQEVDENIKLKDNNELQNLEKLVQVTPTESYPYATVNIDSKEKKHNGSIDRNEQNAVQVSINLSKINKLVEVKKDNDTKTMHQYKTAPDYFSDLEMWHNDILNSENYTSWQNILKPIEKPYQYRPPNVTVLKKELNRLNKHMGERGENDTDSFNMKEKLSKVTNSPVTNKEVSAKSVIRRNGDNKEFNFNRNMNEETSSYLNKSQNSVLLNLTSTTNQYLKLPNNHITHNVRNEGDEVKSMSGTSTAKYADTGPETTLSLDTTLLAYDDSFNFLTETNDEQTSKSSLNSHALDTVNILTKLHKVPEQYFSTPLPMRSEDFEAFLKEHDIDVKSVTDPLNFSSTETLKPKESDKFLNFYPSRNQTRYKVIGKINKLDESKSSKGKSTEKILNSTPNKNIGRYYEMENDLENKLVDDHSFIPMTSSNDERTRREIYKYLHITASKPDVRVTGIYSKYSKTKKNFREKFETVPHSTNPDNVETTEFYFDDLEHRLQAGKLEVDRDNGSDFTTTEKTLKHDFGNPLLEHNFSQTHKYVDFDTFENKNKKNISMSELSRIFSGVKPNTNLNERRLKLKDKEKPNSSYSQFVHNNLLFNYMYDNGKQEKINKHNNADGNSYNTNVENSVFMKTSSQPEQQLKLPKIQSNPKRIHIASKSLKYDIIFNEDESSNKHNMHKLDEKRSSTPHCKFFENYGFYTMNAKNESTSDSEDEQIKELVRVVEAVENFTRPNVLIHVDLPTYYEPDTDSTDPTPLRAPKSIWNDFILKYVSGIALIELLTKFGILKTVETNLSDGMDEDVNNCGRFSGIAEPRFAMDLMSADRSKRIQRYNTEEDTTTDMSTTSTLEPVRRGTMIYDLKQQGRAHSVGLRPWGRSYKRGPSVVTLLQKQNDAPNNDTTQIVIPSTTKVTKPSTQPRKETTTTEATTTTTKKEMNTERDNEKEKYLDVKENKFSDMGVKETTERVVAINENGKKTKHTTTETSKFDLDTLTTKITTPQVKLLKAFGTIAIHTLGDREHTTTRDLPLHSGDNTKQAHETKVGDYHFYIATTKILSKGSGQDNLQKEAFINKKPQLSGDKNDMTEISSSVSKVSPVTKNGISTTTTATTLQKNLNITKPPNVELLTSKIFPLFSPSEANDSMSAYDNNYYVTSSYYDYRGLDNDYDDEENKNVTSKNDTKVKGNSKIKHDKRELKSQNTFTARDVAAIEVIVDLLRHNRNSNENEINENTSKSSFAHPLNPTQTSSRSSGPSQSSGPSLKKPSDLIKNSIQVHIAIPCNLTFEKKRSLNDPVRIRKVFSAKLSTPVDMEYQIHSEDLESISTEPNVPVSSTVRRSSTSEKFSPGLYVLVENKNNSFPTGQFILKPVRNNKLLFDYTIRQAPKEISTQKVTSTQPSNLSKVTLSKDFIEALNKHLMDLYNLVVTPEHEMKERKMRSVKVTPKSSRNRTSKFLRLRRNVSWDTIKKYFGHDKVCHCHCKPNRTMCRACAASDAVISELIFELDNLAQYMSDHCTEIQTYFWMNPSGGRKLRDAVQRIDKALLDYYKRVKGKCKGRPCKVFTTYMDKRDFVRPDKNPNYIGDPLIRDVEKIADQIELASHLNIGDKNLIETGNKCLDAMTKCMHLKPFNKRANESDNRRVKNVYSLDNVNVNIICKSDTVENTQMPNVYFSSPRNTPYLTESPSIFYYDDTGDYTMETKQKKGIKSLLTRKNYLKKKKKDKKLWFTYNVTSNDNYLRGNLKKRQVTSNTEMNLPLAEYSKGSMWYNILKNHKNRSQYLGEGKQIDDIKLNNDDIESMLNVSKIENNSYNSYDISVNEIDKNITTEVYPLYSKVLNDTDLQMGLHTNLNDTKSKPLETEANKIMNMNLIKLIGPDFKDFLHIRSTDDFEHIQDVKPLGSNVTPIQNKKETSVVVGPEIKHQQKPNNDPFPPKKVSTLTTAPDKKIKKVNVTHQNFLRRFKDATLKFFDSFLLDKKTTSPTVFSKSSKSKRSFKNHLTKMKRKKGTSLNNNKNQNENNHAINHVGNEENPLKAEVDDSVTGNKELLLSILDFETNKLNDEWERIASKKGPHDDSDADTQTVFHLHSEVSMPPQKPPKPKEHTIIAPNPNQCHKPSTIPVQSKPKTNNTKKTTKVIQPTQKKSNPSNDEDEFYDIKKDLPNIELRVPPELTSTKACHGFLDKFINQFKFKVVPNPRNVKVAKNHRNGPKGRSLKRKMEHTARLQGKARDETAGKETDLHTPGTIVIRITALSDSAEHAEELKRNVTGSNITTSTVAAVAKNASRAVETKQTEAKAADSTTSEPRANETKSTDSKPTKPTEDNRKNGNNNKFSEEVCETGARDKICDIDATLHHILEMHRTLSQYSFKRFVKNITCFKYKKKPSIFRIRAKSKKKKSRQHVRSDDSSDRWRWNWVRGKRSSDSMNPSEDMTGDNDFDNEYFNDDVKDGAFDSNRLKKRLANTFKNEIGDYDRLYLGGDGVYRRRESERQKRKVDMTNVVSGLKSLPPLRELVDEVFVIRGNSITIYCNVSGTPLYTISNLTNMYRYSWAAERKSMLSTPNLRIVGPSLVINDVQPKNYGTYTCCQDRIVTRSVRLNVIEIPHFNIVFTPVYKCLGECTYEDLENIQSLGTEMIKAANCCGHVSCSIRVDHPISLLNKENEDLLKPTVVVTAAPPGSINCDPECQRDLTCSLALLWAGNAPALAFVKVVIMYDKFNNSLTPVDCNTANMVVSKKLKNKDSNGHKEYVDLSLNMAPGDVDVVVACPAGFYLLTEQKICAVCPANTCAAEGENTCSACPRGTHSEPGSAACRLGIGRLHSYVERCAVVPWQWSASLIVLTCGGCVCLVLGLWMCHRHAFRPADPNPEASRPNPERNEENSEQCTGVGRRRMRRPLSPSRVLLERLYKHSRSSSRATDSQETKLVLTQDLNIPPPVPPIDFDY